MSASQDLARRCFETLNRLCKWRQFYSGWQLGTRQKGDAESDAVRDHREATLIMRVELRALTAILIRKNILTEDEWNLQLIKECELYDKHLESRYPGFKATDDGLAMDVQLAGETMQRMNFRP